MNRNRKFNYPERLVDGRVTIGNIQLEFIGSSSNNFGDYINLATEGDWSTVRVDAVNDLITALEYWRDHVRHEF